MRKEIYSKYSRVNATIMLLEITGETPETFVNFIHPIEMRENNSILLAMFNVIVSTINLEVRKCLSITDDV